MQTESVLQTKNRSEPAKNRFSVALSEGTVGVQQGYSEGTTGVQCGYSESTRWEQ